MIDHIKIDSSDNKELYAFPYGIDDFIVFASALKKYKDKNPDKKIYLLVLSPSQPAFQTQSFIKELALEYDYIDDVYEMENIIIEKNNRLAVDKKKIDRYIKIYSQYIKFDKIRIIEFDPMIKKDDYRFNTYFQSSTLLGLEHSMPKYILPSSVHKREGALNWLKDHGINEGEQYCVVQLKSRFANKTVKFELYKKVFDQFNLGNLKIVEMNGNLVPQSVNLKPEDVTNLTTIEIIKGAQLIVGNVSYAYQIGGILNKKTAAIINPQTPPIIRDFNFNFSAKNIIFLALDGTIVEWENMRNNVPFVQGNKAEEKEVEIKLKEINFYNPKNQKFKLPRLVLAQKDKLKEKLKNNEAVDPPVVWYQSDEKCLRFGGYEVGKDHGIKYQALGGLPLLLAYEDLKYDKVKVKVTNVYRAFF